MEFNYWELLGITSFSLIGLLGTIGNSLVIYIYGFTFKRRYMKFERLMLMLGVFDLLASLINPANFIYRIVTKYQEWHFGKIGCKIIPLLGPMFSYISMGIILVMAIDRDRAVATPFKKQFTIQTIYKAVCVIVVLSILVCVPYMYYINLYLGKLCMVYKSPKLYDQLVIAVFLTSDILFALILGITTVRVFLKLKKNQIITYPKAKELRTKETNRILKIIVAMGILFIVCIFPRDILFLAFHFSRLYPPKLETKNLRHVNEVLKVLYCTNSCINVILYSILNKRFRTEIRHLASKLSFALMQLRYNGHYNDSTSTVRTNSYEGDIKNPTDGREEPLLKRVLSRDGKRSKNADLFRNCLF